MANLAFLDGHAAYSIKPITCNVQEKEQEQVAKHQIVLL
jgi:prepilin-type processing-associated H-X9-DG protein